MRQAGFRAALLDPAAAVPQGLIGPAGAPAGRRFSVYRNNVAVSLTEALAAQFPVVRALVGDDFFRGMAGVFLRAHPPRSPVMALYGADLPTFLEGFAPVAHLGYLPDVARLEFALREAYVAADPEPAGDLTGIAAVPPERAVLGLAPWVRAMRSDWPVHSIWAANTGDAPPPRAVVAEGAVIVRRGFDPIPLAATPAVADAVAALAAGSTLAEAAAPAPEALAPAVTLLAQEGAILNVRERT